MGKKRRILNSPKFKNLKMARFKINEEPEQKPEVLLTPEVVEPELVAPEPIPEPIPEPKPEPKPKPKPKVAAKKTSTTRKPKATPRTRAKKSTRKKKTS